MIRKIINESVDLGEINSQYRIKNLTSPTIKTGCGCFKIEYSAYGDIELDLRENGFFTVPYDGTKIYVFETETDAKEFEDWFDTCTWDEYTKNVCGNYGMISKELVNKYHIVGYYMTE